MTTVAEQGKDEVLTTEFLTEAECKEGYTLHDTGQGGVFLVKGGRAWAIMPRSDLTRRRVALAVDFHRKGWVKTELGQRVGGGRRAA